MAQWRIKFEGHVYREADMTLEQAEQIEALTNSDWNRISPMRSAKHAKATLSVLYAAYSGDPFDKVSEKVGAITVDQFLDMIEADEDDLPVEYEDGFPQPAAEISTPT